MTQFIYTGGHRKDAPEHTKLFDEWWELNGKAINITNQFYIQKLRGNKSFVELDDGLIIGKKGRSRKAEEVIAKPVETVLHQDTIVEED